MFSKLELLGETFGPQFIGIHYIKCDIFKKLFMKLRKLCTNYSSNCSVIIDSSFVMNKFGHNKLGRNKYFKNKNCNKISLITDINGIPMSVLVNKGTVHDLTFVPNHMNDLLWTHKNNTVNKTFILGDKAYESKKIVKLLINMDIK